MQDYTASEPKRPQSTCYIVQRLYYASGGWLAAGLSLWRPRSVHVGFMLDKVALGQVFLQVLWFLPVSIIILWLRIYIQ
jgi:hypothetical protein